MSIVLVRVDNRLIHGQVLEAWVPYTKADCIVVANDALADSVMERMIMEASVPGNIPVIIDRVEEIVHRFASGEFNNKKALILFGNSADVLCAYRSGLHLEKLNLGNMHAGKDKIPCSCTIFLDPSDIRNLNALAQCGVDISSRCVPSDPERSYEKMIPKSAGRL